MKRSRWALVLLAIAVRAFAQPSPAEIRRKEAPSFAELVSLPLVYQAPHLETVSVMRDLVYRKTPGGDLRRGRRRLGDRSRLTSFARPPLRGRRQSAPGKDDNAMKAVVWHGMVSHPKLLAHEMKWESVR